MSKINMQSLLAGLYRIKEEVPEMPLSILITFFGVAVYSPDGALEDPLSFLDLSKKVGLPYTTVSRHLRYLGAFVYPGKPGAGLVDYGELPSDRRQKYVKLTPKGQRLVTQVKTLIGLD